MQALCPLRCRPARHPTHLPVQAQPAVPLIAAQQLREGWHPLLKHHKLIRIYEAWWQAGQAGKLLL